MMDDRVWHMIRLHTSAARCSSTLTTKKICCHERQDWVDVGIYSINPLPDDEILEWSKLKEIADNILTLHSIDTHFNASTTDNFVGKEEIARNERFLLFPQCFILNQVVVSLFVHIFDIISLFAAEFEEPKIGLSGEGLSGI